MKEYTIYDKDGKITSAGYSTGEISNSFETELSLNEFVDGSKFYIDVETKRPVEIPKRPSEDHKFNYSTKTWEYSVSKEELINRIKYKRETLLSKSDWTQISGNPLTSEMKQQWEMYRQALRDITQQSGYPDTINWPTPP